MAQERLDIVVTERGSVVARNNISAIGVAAGGANAALLTLRRTLLGLGAGVALFRTFTSGVRVMEQFSEAIRQVEAVSGATGSQMDYLKNRILELGSTMRFTSTEIADAATILARAGLNLKEIDQSLEATLRFAIAAGTDIATASDLAIGVMRGMNLEIKDMESALDVLVLTANRTNTNIQQLGQAFKFVAPIASSLGMSLPETAASLGILADNAMRADMGGTGLRTVLTRLEAGMPNVQKVVEGMGLSMDDVSISANGLAAVLEKLNDMDVTAVEAFQAFQQRGGPAFLNLVSDVGKLGDLTKELEGAEGSLRRFVEIVDRSLRGALLRVKSAWEAIFLRVADAGFEDVLVTQLDKLARSLLWVANNIDVIMMKFKEAVPFMALLFGPPAIRLLTSFLAWLTRIVFAINPIYGALTLAAGAITFFGDRVVLVAETGTTLKDAFLGFFDYIANEGVPLIVEKFNSLMDYWNSEFVPSMGEGFVTINGQWVSSSQTAGTSFLKKTSDVFKQVLSEFYGLVSAISLSWGSLLDTMVVAMKKAWNSVLTELETLTTKPISEGANSAYKAIGGLFGVDLGNIIDFSPLVDVFRFDIPESADLAAQKTASSFVNEFSRATLEMRNDLDSIVPTIAAGAGSAANRRSFMRQPFMQDLLKPAAIDPLGDMMERENRPNPSNPRPRIDADFAESLRNMEKEITLLQLTGRERDRMTAILDLQEKMERKLTAAETEQLTVLHEKLYNLQQESAILEELRGPQDQFVETQGALNRLLETGAISLGEYNKKLAEARLEVLATATDLEGGIERGLIRIGLQFQDVASVAEEAMVNSFQAIEDSIVKMVTTGEFSIKDLANTIHAELTRIAVRQAITQPLANFLQGNQGGFQDLFGGLFGANATNTFGKITSGIGSIFGSIFGGFRASGGDVMAGKSYIVGEEGPELFKAPQNGTIVPNKDLNSGGSPIQVIMHINGVTDADSFRRSEAQLLARASAAMERSAARRR